MTRLIAVTTAALLAATTAASACNEVKVLTDAWHFANLLCRGSSDKSIIDEACPRRTTVGKQLDALGWCYGKRGQSGAEMAWDRCTTRSYRS